MAFSLSNLQSDTRYCVFGDSSDTRYGSTDLNRNINRWYNTVIGWILTVNGDWQINGDIYTRDLEVGYDEYYLPTNILKINEVYIKSTSQGDYEKAKQRDINTYTGDPETDYNPSIPEFDLIDNFIKIYLPNDVENVTAGIKLYYQKSITELSGDSDAPNLAEPFKRLLSYGAALDYFIANEANSKAKNFKVLIDETKQELLRFYANRSTAKKARITSKERKYF